jgi:hypothetical protein
MILADIRVTLGEQGKVEESMREMAAIEALKSEKADKEVNPTARLYYSLLMIFLVFSENCNN